MVDDYITRKEFEERMLSLTGRFDDKYAALQGQLSESLGIVKTNQGQITTLVSNQSDLQKQQAATDKQVSLAVTMNKYLWPTVTILVGIIMAFAGSTVHL